MQPVTNDGFGRMTTYSRFAGSFVTEVRDDGYYWAHTLPGGKVTPFTGPYPTRTDAKAAEMKATTKR